MQRQIAMSYLKLILCVFIWGGVYHVAKFLLESSDPFTISFLRWLIAAVVLLVIYVAKKGRSGFALNYAQWKTLIFLSLFGVSLYNLLFFGAELYLPANTVAILYAFTPCITVIIGVLFLRNKVNFVTWIGILIATLGAIMVINSSSQDCGKLVCSNMLTQISIGHILAILASIVMAIYTILNRKAFDLNLDTFTITTFASVFGAIVLFVPAILYGNLFLIGTFSIDFWIGMAYISILATIISYRWYSEAVRVIGVCKTAIFQNGVPLASVVLSVIFLSQSISFLVILSGAVIVLGVVLTSKSMSD